MLRTTSQVLPHVLRASYKTLQVSRWMKQYVWTEASKYELKEACYGVRWSMVSQRASTGDVENMFLDIDSCAMNILWNAIGSLGGHWSYIQNGAYRYQLVVQQSVDWDALGISLDTVVCYENMCLGICFYAMVMIVQRQDYLNDENAQLKASRSRYHRKLSRADREKSHETSRRHTSSSWWGLLRYQREGDIRRYESIWQSLRSWTK